MNMPKIVCIITEVILIGILIQPTFSQPFNRAELEKQKKEKENKVPPERDEYEDDPPELPQSVPTKGVSTTTLITSKPNGSLTAITSSVSTSTFKPEVVGNPTDNVKGNTTTATTMSSTTFVGPNTTPIPSPTQAGGGQSSTMASTLGLPTKVSTGNKPMISTTIPSVSTGNKPMISTTIPSVSIGNKPMISTTIPSVSTGNKPMISTTIPSVIISSSTKVGSIPTSTVANGTGIVKVTTVPSIISSITEVGKESTTIAYQSSTINNVWTSVVELDDEKGTSGWSRRDRVCDEREIISSKDKVIPVKFGPYQSPITYIYVLSDDMDFKGSKLVGGGLHEKEATIEFRSDGDSQRIYLAMVCWNKPKK